MKKTYLFLISIFFTLTGCINGLNKSITEELTLSELNENMKKEPLLVDYYENIRLAVDNMSDIKKASYSDITYKRIFKYLNFLHNTQHWQSFVKVREKDWADEFGIYQVKADSMLKYWGEYLDEKSLDNYVKIELKDTKSTMYGSYESLRINFEITPLRGKIDHLEFMYSYKFKNNDIGIGEKYQHSYRGDYFISKGAFDTPIIGQTIGTHDEKELFGGYLTAKSVKFFYDVLYDIRLIRKDGVDMRPNDIVMPKIVRDYLENEKDGSLARGDRDELIKLMLSKDYISKNDYIEKKADIEKEKKDKLCFNFFYEVYSFK